MRVFCKSDPWRVGQDRKSNAGGNQPDAARKAKPLLLIATTAAIKSRGIPD